MIAFTKGVELIIDSAGGNQFNQLIKALKPGGKIVFYGATNGLPEKIKREKTVNEFNRSVEKQLIMPVISGKGICL